VLDVVLFRALKKHATGFSRRDEEQAPAPFRIKVYHNFKEMTLEVNIWGAFSSIGIIHDIDQNPCGGIALQRGKLPTKSTLRQTLGAQCATG
jgi:hypothetical protein